MGICDVRFRPDQVVSPNALLAVATTHAAACVPHCCTNYGHRLRRVWALTPGRPDEIDNACKMDRAENLSETVFAGPMDSRFEIRTKNRITVG